METETINKVIEVLRAIMKEYGLTDWAPMVQGFIMQEPQKAVEVFKKIKRIVNQ